MKYFLSISTCAILAGLSAPAFASINTDTLKAVVSASAQTGSPRELQLARNGADDPAGDDRGGATKQGDGKGRGGHDDGANHA